METGNLIVDKSIEFSLEIVKIYKFLISSKWICAFKTTTKVRTSIGANVVEAQRGFTKKEFTHKLNISLGEASETRYWLFLLYKAEFIDKEMYINIDEKCREIIKILTSIIKK